MAVKRGRKWVQEFLKALAESPNVSAACHRAGIARQFAYKVKDEDPAFSAAWDDALEQSTDALVGEAYRRARDGTAKPVFYKGDECGVIKEYSDTLTIFLLKAHRPDVYRDNTEPRPQQGNTVVDLGADDHAPPQSGEPSPA